MAHVVEGIWIIKRLLGNAKRAEPLELSQILTRYALGAVITLYVIFNPETGTQLASRPNSVALMLIIAWAVGLGVLAHLMHWPGSHLSRRTVSISADAIALSLLIHYGERSAAIFFPVYLWVILGNGFRFGIGYMYASMTANGVCFIIVVLTTPYWRQEWQFSAGLIAAIIAIPVYTSSLIRKVRLAMEQAKAASKAKTEFLSLISHELRTPLNAILGLAQVSRITATGARERENAAFTEIAANRLKRMLDSILKFQAIEDGAGHVQKKKFDVFELLAEVEAILVPLARKKGLELSFRFKTPVPKLLTSDPDIIETVIINLVTNAIKYTASGYVIVELGYLDGTTCRLDVHDSGPGIDPGLQPRIFDQFVRSVPRHTEDEGGVGLGLSLCKSLIKLLGGDIGFKSERDQGSTFWAKFPAEATALPKSSWQDINIAAFGFDAGSCADLTHGFKTFSGRDTRAPCADRKSSYTHENSVAIADASAITAADHELLCQFLANTAAPLIVIDSSGRAASPFSRRAAAAVPSPCAVSPQLVYTVLSWHQRHNPPSELPEPSAYGKRTILVADDNAMNRQVMAQMLKLGGYAVIEAQTGDEALEHLLACSADAAILDVNLADQDGVEICKAYLSAAAPELAAPIAGLTADISKETRDRCLSAGMVEVLTKPVALEDLRALLARLSNKAAQIRSGAKRDELVPILDCERVNQLIELFGEDTFKKDFLAAFEAETSVSIERLNAEIALNKPDGSQKILHAIKSSARTMGALRLAEQVAYLEEWGLSQVCQDSKVSIASELDMFIHACKVYLEHHVEARANNPQAGAAKDSIAATAAWKQSRPASFSG